MILLTHSGLASVHQKAFGLLADGTIDEGADPIPLSRCISFLVGMFSLSIYLSFALGSITERLLKTCR